VSPSWAAGKRRRGMSTCFHRRPCAGALLLLTRCIDSSRRLSFRPSPQQRTHTLFYVNCFCKKHHMYPMERSSGGPRLDVLHLPLISQRECVCVFGYWEGTRFPRCSICPSSWAPVLSVLCLFPLLGGSACLWLVRCVCTQPRKRLKETFSFLFIDLLPR
jgi:hypothetical protein